MALIQNSVKKTHYQKQMPISATSPLDDGRVRTMHDHAHIAAGFPVICQKTLKTDVFCHGVGLHSGSVVRMVLHPAPADHGIVFCRSDLPGKPRIPATWDMVTDTRLNTCIGDPKGAGIHTIEHLMSALAGLGIDNVLIDIDGPEVPVMDGSSAPFLALLSAAGLCSQNAARHFLKILKPVSIDVNGNRAMITPAPQFSAHFEITFQSAAIGHQTYDFEWSEEAYQTEISKARTFGFEHEIEQMRAAGLGRGGSLENAVVISGDRVLNPNGLRYPDEFVRHKILDAIGDLYLAGGPLIGHFTGIRSGHALNNMLLRAIFADETAWTWTNSHASSSAQAAFLTA